jgi:hypothetical protein
MNRFTLLITLLFVTTLTFLSSCKSDDGATEVRKAFLTAHTWAYERVSVNGGANQVAQFPDEYHMFHADGTYTKETREDDGSRTQMNGKWELQEKGSKLRMYNDFFETTSSIREINDSSLKITRQDPDLTVEIDFVPAAD